jgi:hypothetical protein
VKGKTIKEERRGKRKRMNKRVTGGRIWMKPLMKSYVMIKYFFHLPFEMICFLFFYFYKTNYFHNVFL